MLGKGFPFRADAFLRAWLHNATLLLAEVIAILAGVAALHSNPCNVSRGYLLLCIEVSVVNSSKPILHLD